MFKKISAIVLTTMLFFSPLVEAGSFSGGSSGGSRPSISTPSRPSVSTPAPSTSRPSSIPSSSTYSSKGGFSGGSSTVNTPTYRSGYGNSNIRSYPSTNYNVHWYSPNTWGTGFTTGILMGSMMHPWGGYYGAGGAYGYYGISIGAMIFDTIFLIFFIWLIWYLVRRFRD